MEYIKKMKANELVWKKELVQKQELVFNKN